MAALNAKRYQVVRCANTTFLVSSSSFKILSCLREGNEYSYSELSAKTDIPCNSLYVFCERLQKAKLIRRVKRTEGTPRRTRTTIVLQSKVEFVKPVLVR